MKEKVNKDGYNQEAEGYISLYGEPDCIKEENKMEQDFRDWLGWNDQDPPDEDDPDYYTYSWGMNVWINSAKYYKK